MTIDHQVAWDDLITTEFADFVAATAGLNGALPAGSEATLVRIFAAAGGLPLFDGELDEAERTRLGLRLLGEAAARALGRSGRERAPSGFVLEDRVGQAFSQEVVALERVPVNTAATGPLAALPAIGEVTAARIVAERGDAGPFSSIEELTDRISGLGDNAASELRESLRFDHPDEDWRYSLPTDFSVDTAFASYLHHSTESDPRERLLAALDRLATSTAGDPHPASRLPRPRRPHPAPVEPAHPAWAAVLVGSAYFREMPDLLAGATASIDVAMFHVAFSEPEHPTRALLNALVAARDSGISVRVLLDRDRPTDPYGSTVINTPAREFLLANGVACRFDDEATLLHSKYVVIDGQTVVIGSHNWSAGSFFHFDDVSVVIGSADYASELQQSFVSLWDAAAP